MIKLSKKRKGRFKRAEQAGEKSVTEGEAALFAASNEALLSVSSVCAL